MRIVFMGSGPLACPALASLLEAPDHQVPLVVTQPDRPSGRRLHLAACPVRKLAVGRGIPVLSPEKVGAPDVVARLKALSPDLIVVADFGQFLTASVLAIPGRGTVNIHPSLLPRYRGAAPVQWAIANGDTATGVTILYVTEKMDAGDIILQEKVPIREDATCESLTPLLAHLGAALLLRALRAIEAGAAPRIPQDEAAVILAPKLKKEDGRVDWEMPAEAIRNRVRGFQPWPGCFCEVPEGSGHHVKILKARVESAAGHVGHALEWSGDGPLIACGDQSLRLLELQPEGKKPMSASAYVNGHKLRVGDRLG